MNQHPQHIRQVMRALGCTTQRELADLLMIRESAVSNWLRTGMSVKGLRRAQAVADERGVTLPSRAVRRPALPQDRLNALALTSTAPTASALRRAGRGAEPHFATLLSLPPRRVSAASLTALAPGRAFLSSLRNSSQLSMLPTYSAFLQDVTVKL